MARARGNEPAAASRRVADNIRLVRTSQRMTQADLSQRMTDAGRPIPVASVGKIESGLRKLDIDDLATFADVLGVSVGALFGTNPLGEHDE
jgi:transcriptional regulator with XRE-family HTH domain